MTTTLPTIVLSDPPEPQPGDPCAYCGLRLYPGRMVISVGLGYCDATCADLGLHVCGDCGGDVRIPSDPALGAAACPHQAGWVR